MKKTLIFIGIGIVAIIATILVVMNFSYQNTEVEIREQINAKINVNKASYSKMWEIISQKAEVSEKYSQDFKEIYPGLISGRYSNGQGQLMNWIQEHNPNFDTSLYKDLMVSIEGQRESFFTNQEQLQDLSRQHNVLLNRVPSKWFLGDVEKIEVPNVINVESQRAFDTGLEQDMQLFNKK